ncbi:MAG: glycosyltransferase family 4 protein [Thermodesulfobacteriota bacterium]
METIIHVITRLDMGGSAQNTLATCLGTAGRYRNILVHGLARESRMTAEEEAILRQRTEEGRRRGVVFLPMASLVRRISPLNDTAAAFALWRLCRRLRPAIVHTHTSKAGIVGRLAARLAGVETVVHTPHGHVFFGYSSRAASLCFILLERLFTRLCDRLIALTPGERRDYLDRRVAPAGKIDLVHSGVDLKPFADGVRQERRAALRRLGLPEDCGKIVGTVGWLSPIKNPLGLFEAMEQVWQRFPEAHLVYVGKGELEEELRRRIDKSGKAERVSLLGWRRDIHLIMPLFDCFVLASLNEGMGRVLVEAMAAGRPLVATRVCGIPDLVEDGDNGHLVEPDDPAGMAAAIARILADPEGAAAMGERGRRRSRHFSQEEMLRLLDGIYRQAIARRPQRLRLTAAGGETEG